MTPRLQDGAFELRDGAVLPYRVWLPAGPPHAVVLALHGFNDSRDAWEIPAPAFAAAGIAVYSPDQRGFGAAPGRGLWAGGDTMADDAADMFTILRRRHPDLKLIGMGESMGGAVLMHMATRAPHPPTSLPRIDGYVMVAPAVWGRARMNVFMRVGLWLAATLVPGLEVSRPPPPARVWASDNRDALDRLSRNKLTIRATRFDTLRGLVDLMDTALAAAARFNAPALFQYGAHDQLVPPAATAATWNALPEGNARFAFYHDGWHLLMRDIHRDLPINDAIAWINAPNGYLPSAAEPAARNWMRSQA